MVGPIEKLTAGAEKIAAGNFGNKLLVESTDEIGILTGTFNEMAGVLQTTLDAVENERNKLDTLFLHMTDGVVAFDHQSKLIHCNPAATAMAAVAATGGQVLIKNIIPKHMDCITAKLLEMGVDVEEQEDTLLVRRTRRLQKANVKTMTLFDALEALYEKYGNYAEKTYNLVMPGLDGLADMAKLMNSLRDNPPAEIGGDRVVARKDYSDGTVTDCVSGAQSAMNRDVMIALDFPTKAETLAFLNQFTEEKPFVKIGMEVDLDVLGYIDPDITVNVIRNGIRVAKKHLELPHRLVNIIHCKNPRCITVAEPQLDAIFLLSDPEKRTYRCAYCEAEKQRKL